MERREIATGERAATGARGRRVRRLATPYLFLIPALAWYLVFLGYPIATSLHASFTDWDGLSANRPWIGLENYRDLLFEDRTARRALENNLIWTGFSILVPTMLGLFLAVALNAALPGRILLRSIFFAPGVLPLVGVGLIWAWLYNPQFGFVNELLTTVGLEGWTRGWLSDYETAFPATLVTSLWVSAGFPMIFYLAGLQGIPNEQYDAAKIDGAGRFHCFRDITLPWLRETHVIVLSLTVISSVKVFDLIYTMTYGGPGRETQVLATWMYFNTFKYNHGGYGSAIAWMIAIISLIVTIPYIRRMTRR